MQDHRLQRPCAAEHEGVPARVRRGMGLLAQLPGLVEVGVEGADGQQVQAQRAKSLIADVGGQLDRPRGGGALDVERAGRIGDEGKAGQEVGLKLGAFVRCAVDRPPQEAHSLPTAPIEVPQPGQGRREAPAGVGVFGREAPPQRRAQVVVFKHQRAPPPVGIALPIFLCRLDEP